MITRGYWIRAVRFSIGLAMIAVLAACAPIPQGPAGPTASIPAPGATTVAGTPVATTLAATQEASPLERLPKNADGYTDISVLQLAGSMPKKNYTLVNVHIPYEGELPQTDLMIPYNEITQHTDKLPDKNAPIVLYCRSGSMSTTAAQDLVKLGYTNVYEVDGGMVAWEQAGWDLLHRE